MFRNCIKSVLFRNLIKSRKLSDINLVTKRKSPLKIAICGAAGSIGQIVSLFLKQSLHSLDICLYDSTPELLNVSRQLSLVNSKNSFKSYNGPGDLRQALQGADIVTILVKGRPADRATANDIFEQNIVPVGNIAKCCIDVCPTAILTIGTPPLNFIIPAVNEIYKYYGVDYSDKIIGFASMDAMQADTIYAHHFKLDPCDILVPVTGGTSVDTCVPIFSEATPVVIGNEVEEYHSEQLHKDFLEQKNLEFNADLVTGFSVSKFLESLIYALTGQGEMVETAFIRNPDSKPAKYLTSLVDLGENGIQTVYDPPVNLNRFERRMLDTALSNLHRDIDTAEKHIFLNRKNEIYSRVK